MLSLAGFPPPCNAIPQFLPSPTKTQLFFHSHRPTHHSFYPFLGRFRTGFYVSSLKSRGNGGHTLLEMGGFDDDDGEDEDGDGEDEDGDGEDEDGDGEDDEEDLPLRSMKDWLENKPRGFGEGKVYDTSIEDKLLDEMLQSREAQAANINELKNSPQEANSSKEVDLKQRAPEVVPSAICVRVVNLPKKKNIDRDLQRSFKGVPGIESIIPAVSGNKKTRDPICRGFAFIGFKSEKDAKRFVEMFSGQSISFGKIEKQIRCEIMNAKSPTSADEHSAMQSYNASQLEIASLEEVPDVDFDIDNGSSDSWEIVSSDESEGRDDENVPAQGEEDSENLKPYSLSEQSLGDSLGTRTESVLEPSSKKHEHVQAKKKRPESKRKRTKALKLKVPGSANRLKIKEKAVLSGVLSKYSEQAALASKKQP